MCQKLPSSQTSNQTAFLIRITQQCQHFPSLLSRENSVQTRRVGKFGPVVSKKPIMRAKGNSAGTLPICNELFVSGVFTRRMLQVILRKEPWKSVRLSLCALRNARLPVVEEREAGARVARQVYEFRECRDRVPFLCSGIYRACWPRPALLRTRQNLAPRVISVTFAAKRSTWYESNQDRAWLFRLARRTFCVSLLRTPRAPLVTLIVLSR